MSEFEDDIAEIAHNLVDIAELQVVLARKHQQRLDRISIALALLTGWVVVLSVLVLA